MNKLLGYASLAISLLALAISVGSLWVNRIRQKKRMEKSNDIFSMAIGTIKRSGNFESANEISNLLREVLNLISKAFSLRTDSTCHASVFVLSDASTHNESFNIEDLKVTTLARDTGSVARRRIEDKFGEERSVTSDTPFLHILHSGEDAYFSNNIMMDITYRNSYISFYNIGSVSAEKRKWPLPYKSQIVWPICKTEGNGNHSYPGDTIVGFLAVDSDESGVFKRERDIPIGKKVSNKLFPVLLKAKEWS